MKEPAKPRSAPAKQPPVRINLGPRVAHWPIAKVKRDPRNARLHPEEQLERLVASIRTFGFNAPIGVDKAGVIVYGHGRLTAAERLGMKAVPVVVLQDVDERTRRAYAIADNRIAELATWDEDELRRTAEELIASNLDMEALGFNAQELADLLDSGEPEPAARGRDDVPEVKGKPITERGDMWRLGEHLLVCGLAEDPATWKRMLASDPHKAACVFTDPPYGVDYRPNPAARVKNDELVGARLQALITNALKQVVPFTRDDAAFYVWHATSHRHEFEGALAAAGLVERQQIVWVKPSPNLGHADYQWSHEVCFYASRDGEKPAWYGGRDQGTVWRIALAGEVDQAATIGSGVEIVDGETGASLYLQPRVAKGRKARRVLVQKGQVARVRAGDDATTCWEVSRDVGVDHPTPKPVDLAVRALQNSTKVSDVVLDPFGGSGSTLIAAETSARICRTSEIDPRHCDQIVARWERITGRKGELVRSGAVKVSARKARRS
jgi:DNA modification methylase